MKGIAAGLSGREDGLRSRCERLDKTDSGMQRMDGRDPDELPGRVGGSSCVPKINCICKRSGKKVVLVLYIVSGWNYMDCSG